MPVSIIEIASAAGVSKSTVSRVLNRDPRVSAEAIAAVTAAVSRLGYKRTSRQGRPRRPPTGVRTGMFAFLIPDTNPDALRTVLSGRLLRGIEAFTRQKGLNLMITGLPAPGRLPPIIEQRQVDGIFLRGTPPEAERPQLVAAIGDTPCVQVFEPRGLIPANWDIVLEDNDSIGQLAARWLLQKGRRHWAFISRLPDHPSMRHRGRSFEARAQQSGCRWVRLESEQPMSELVRQLLSANTFPDGIFCPGPDEHVVELYRALAAAGKPVGTAIDLVSCNNDALRLATLDPALVNIDIEPESIGRAAAEMLIWRLQAPGEPQRRLSVAPILIG